MHNVYNITFGVGSSTCRIHHQLETVILYISYASVFYRMGQSPTRDLKLWSNGAHCNPVFLPPPRLFPECTLVTAARRLPLQSADNRTFDTCERDEHATGLIHGY